ncbi:hypothetical protein F2P81_026306 [Scophthalmus maximus]|uniref:PX domain-containing protein n=1 Tax=Scophthalmus maximus TaxID=52904 RepID=A0A6A4RQY7_SCOMX|nr:hypothetical protein F2P81_026306 [Scophthalmus maximus]
MEEQSGLPNVSIPCHNEQRDKKKRYTVYKVIVSVQQQEWFVFRRYAEFDKLYNTNHFYRSLLAVKSFFSLALISSDAVKKTVSLYEPENSSKADIRG